MLAITAFISCVLCGYTMSVAGARDWVMISAFALVLTAIFYVIVDYDIPRVGLVRIDFIDQVLARHWMK